MSEEWKQIEGFSDYLVSDHGRICSLKSGLLKPHENSRGYMLVTLNGETRRLHRIVASAFVPNPDNKEMVNHKDGDPMNNKAENLEWNTNGENQRHRYSVLNKDNCKKQVEKLSGKKVIRTYESVRECERLEGISKDGLRDLIRKQKSRNGFLYRYKDLKNDN